MNNSHINSVSVLAVTKCFVLWFPGTESWGLRHKVPPDSENPGCCEGDCGWANGTHLV